MYHIPACAAVVIYGAIYVLRPLSGKIIAVGLDFQKYSVQGVANVANNNTPLLIFIFDRFGLRSGIIIWMHEKRKKTGRGGCFVSPD